MFGPKTHCVVVVGAQDRKSTRLNSSHVSSSYAVFCLKKKTSHQHSLPAAAPHAYGILINYCVAAVHIATSKGTIPRTASASARTPNDIDIWHIACHNC